MKCPIDNVELQMTDRQGIEIDYCPTCRGIWLDRGELDKLIERSENAQPQQSQAYPQQNQLNEEYGHGKHGYKKRKSFLGELLDF